MQKDCEFLKEKAKQLRSDVAKMTTKARIGHVTSSYSCTELMVALYYGGILRYRIEEPDWKGRDYFILSKGHANPILYSILMDLGFIEKEEKDRFCTSEGALGVLLRGDLPGTEITSGSLGCGLGIAAGIAQALKIDGKENAIVCMLGDAECREGAIWEAAMHIGYTKLDNIVVIVDRNNLGATHFVEEEAGIGDVAEKFSTFGFDTVTINGHDFEDIFNAIGDIRHHTRKKPLAIIANTKKGKGVSFIEDQVFMHGVAIPEEKLEDALREIREGEVL